MSIGKKLFDAVMCDCYTETKAHNQYTALIWYLESQGELEKE